VEAERDIVKATLRGVNRAIILWLISTEPMSGYRVIKEMERLTDQKFHQGTIYPLLYELEKNGAVQGEWKQKGRLRIKHYQITQNGEKLLSHLREVFNLPIKEALEDLIEDKNSTQKE
jgi:DNA-binding PadR family transcriptional regulator